VRVLGLDTATRRASVGLLANGRVVAEQSQNDGRHAVHLLPLIDSVLQQGGCAVRDLDAIAVSSGPGSFTGLRVGLSVAKGVACATNVPLVGIPTLEALARTLDKPRGTICTLLDARKGEVYAAYFVASERGWTRLIEDTVTTPEAVVAAVPTPCTIIGDAVLAYGEFLRDRLGPEVTVLPWHTYGPRGGTVATLGAERLLQGGSTDLPTLEPSYVRPPDAKVATGLSA
jgi:tRNA threonylcarbamoyladenosine biosynthesis protein TsaB